MLRLFLTFSFFVFLSFNAKSEKKITFEKYEKSRNKIKKNEIKKRNVLSKLYEINRKIKRKTVSKNKIKKSIYKNTQVLLIKKNKVKILEENILEKKKEISKRLYSLYKNYVLSSKASAIFEISNAHDMDKNSYLMSQLSEWDKKEIKLLENKKRDLVVEVSSIKKIIKELNKNKRNVEVTEKKLGIEYEKKSTLLSDIRKRKKYYLKVIDKIRKKAILKNNQGTFIEKNLSNLSSLIEEAFFEQKGKLVSPLGPKFKVLKKIGLEKEDIFNFSIMNKHVLLSSVEGNDSVYSLFSGVVEFSKMMKGYGNVLVVNHGDNYRSIYSGIRVLVKKGDRVKQGQMIAKLKKSVYFPNKTLYLQVRHFTEILDPLKWIKKSNDKYLALRKTND